MSYLTQRLVNVMLGIHLGDAFGVPFEMMTRPEILEATRGKGVAGPTFDLPVKRKVPDTRGLAAGSTSDDSQLADAVADACIQGDGYDHDLHVLFHLFALHHDVAGWGGTTKRSLYEIDKWYRQRPGARIVRPSAFRTQRDERLWDEAEARGPREPARWREMSRGNGVAMKIAPFAAFLAARGGSCPFQNGQALVQILQLGRITHADPICSIAGYAVASVVYDRIVGLSAEYAFLSLAKRLAEAEQKLESDHRGEERFSNALKTAFSLTGDPEKLWAFGTAGKSDALTSVPLAIAIWYRHCEDGEPTAAVLEAINAGGDTDTVASMVGAMMGAGGDEWWWPLPWLAALRDGGESACKLGKLLCDAAQRTYQGRSACLREARLRKELGYT